MKNVKDISIKNYLTQRGISPKSDKPHYGMYLSPFRIERKPSFKVDYVKNLWHDFGIGVGGSIIDLVMKMENCSVAEAFRKLESGDYSSSQWVTPPMEAYKSSTTTEIFSVGTIKNRHLIAYLKKRAIDLEITRLFCREVYYMQNGRQYFAIGFKSDGGWELRNEYYKGGTSPKAPMTIDIESDTCLVFEGFMDMLSYLTLKGMRIPPVNIVVMNSVGNLKKASDFISKHKTIHCFLDNDEAGRKALAEVQKLDTEVVDCSHIYAGYKDMNDYLIAQNRVTKQSRVKVKF